MTSVKFFLVRGLGVLLAACLGSCHADRKTGAATAHRPADGPRVLDDRLELTLFAQHPDIVTPIGIAVDSLDRVFVLESNTHQRPKDYPGPAGDVIRVFADEDGDGAPEKTSVFAEGLEEGLNMAFSPEGVLHVVTSRAVWALHDRDGDGKSEKRVKVVELAEPQKVYAHAALLSLAFSHDGWMYISRGNTGGAAWKMVGTDASAVSGYGDGGNIVRARTDGTRLEEVATGFWNPVDLKFDERGRLLAADNDPDSRGPNRLLHIVPGGDYGYESLYGGSGIHPYLAWNGELPGTLPYAVGLGEAPSGLLNANAAALPKDYKGQLLCTIWEESRIVRVALAPKGVSATGTTEVVVEGDEQFRPVAFAADRRGNVYITDWMLRDYANHGKGRVWRLSAKPGVPVMRPAAEYDRPAPDPEGKPMYAIQKAGTQNSFDRLTEALCSEDAFLRHTAVMTLTDPVYRQRVIGATADGNPAVRLGALLALRRSGDPGAEPILRRLLADPDGQVRRQALIWAGKAGMAGLRPHIDRALTAGPVTPALFETYLETVSHLAPAFIKAYHDHSETYAKSIPRRLPPRFIETFIADHSRPAALRAMALRHLEEPGGQVKLLTAMLGKEKDPQLRLEAVRTLANIPDEAVAGQLLKLAATRGEPALVRAEALLALARQPIDAAADVIPLLQDPEPDVRVEAARYLRTRVDGEGVREALQGRYQALADGPDDPVKEQLALALSPEGGQRPASPEAWQTLLAAGGDPARGRRVFYSVQSMCAACHAAEGRGGDLGPDLSNVGKSKSRTQLVRSILRPSEEISPEYQGWFVRLKNGEEHQGRQIDVGSNNIELYTQAREFVSFDKKDVADYGMIRTSLMPEGLEKQLTATDLRDLAAFLEAGKE